MNFSLTPELEELVRSKVRSGRYLSASEVIREALRLLEEQDKLIEIRRDALREEVQRGLDSGSSEPLDIAAIKAKGRKKISRGK